LAAYERRLDELGMIFGPRPGGKHNPEQAELVRMTRDQENDLWFKETPLRRFQPNHSKKLH
jgi:hypothetical protein